MFLDLFHRIKKNSFILAKHLSEKQKEKISELFLNGTTIDELAIEFSCTKLTISRNLKNNVGEDKFKSLIQKNKLNIKNLKNTKKPEKENKTTKTESFEINPKNFYNSSENEFLQPSSFTELTPLFLDIDNVPQKDYTSVSIDSVTFPDLVYMIVDKNIELNVKSLREYPEWQYLSESELDRKTIEIFYESKLAKLKCIKDQKVIKVPNTKVFKVVRSILISKGISRIINNNQLIAL